MGLAETQRALAQLYTNAELRERFFADPLKIGAELGLSADETGDLARLSAAQVNLFAGSLHHKRLQEVRVLLPLTTCALGERRMAALFYEHARSYVPRGVRKHRTDAAAFADYLAAKTGLSENPAPDWISDLARYEMTWLATAEMTRGLVVRRFHFAVNQAARPAAAGERDGEAAPAPKRQSSLAVWFRLSPRRKLRHLFLTLPFK